MAAAMVAPASPAAAASASDLTAFLAAYRCELVERLRMIHADPAPDARHLIIYLLDAPRAYVQCLFVENDSKILCEAKSELYRQKAGEPRRFRMTPQSLAALARLGFSTDDFKGNYRRIIDLTGPANSLWSPICSSQRFIRATARVSTRDWNGRRRWRREKEPSHAVRRSVEFD